MRILDLVRGRRTAILDGWFERVRATYPEPMQALLAKTKDPFANPVGHAIRSGTAALLDGLLRGATDAEMAAVLDEIVRVRAIQDFSASRAVGFVFDLKGAVREVARAEGAGEPEGLREFEDRIDAVALLAFDAYMACREQVYRLKANELRDRSRRVIDRLHARYDWGAGEGDVRPTDEATRGEKR
jgi:hypothetical protein